jgi:glutathione S-transferase
MSASPAKLTLISHALCPYVQRAAIALIEKGLPFERINIDLSNKPEWFLKISPLGKTPVLLVDRQPIFESAVICEYLEDVYSPALHPSDALQRAQHRAWMEFGSSILNNIAGFYSSTDDATLYARRDELCAKFALLEVELSQRSLTPPYFDGAQFSLVDAVFSPVFRYFDVFEKIEAFEFFSKTPLVSAWRKRLSSHTTVISAVSPDYESALLEFLERKNSALSKKIDIKIIAA